MVVLNSRENFITGQSVLDPKSTPGPTIPCKKTFVGRDQQSAIRIDCDVMNCQRGAIAIFQSRYYLCDAISIVSECPVWRCDPESIFSIWRHQSGDPRIAGNFQDCLCSTVCNPKQLMSRSKRPNIMLGIFGDRIHHVAV